MNPAYHIARMRELLAEYEPSAHRDAASAAVDEAEARLALCIPTPEARARDLTAPEPPRP